MTDTARVSIVPNEFQAELVCSALRAAGIECEYQRTSLAGLDWGEVNVGSAGGREVLVAASDLEAARLVVATVEEIDDGADNDPADAELEALMRGRNRKVRLIFGVLALVLFAPVVTIAIIGPIVRAAQG